MLQGQLAKSAYLMRWQVPQLLCIFTFTLCRYSFSNIIKNSLFNALAMCTQTISAEPKRHDIACQKKTRDFGRSLLYSAGDFAKPFLFSGRWLIVLFDWNNKQGTSTKVWCFHWIIFVPYPPLLCGKGSIFLLIRFYALIFDCGECTSSRTFLLSSV